MKPEVKFEDWTKLKLLVGEIMDIVEGNIQINIGDRIMEYVRKINAEKGDKIVVGVTGDNLVVPLIKDSFIVPEKDIEVGSRVS